MTPLIRHSNLSPQRFSSYYDDLIRKNFLTEEVDEKGKKHLTLTNRGFDYLREYKTYLRFLKEFEL
jgi:predicted transcriptional regulator